MVEELVIGEIRRRVQADYRKGCYARGPCSTVPHGLLPCRGPSLPSRRARRRHLNTSVPKVLLATNSNMLPPSSPHSLTQCTTSIWAVHQDHKDRERERRVSLFYKKKKKNPLTSSKGDSLRDHPGLPQLLPKPPPSQQPRHIRANLDARPDLRNGRGPLDDSDFVSCLAEGVGSREPAEATADDEDVQRDLGFGGAVDGGGCGCGHRSGAAVVAA